jgi:sec-independent protein translocase protein TatA
VLAATIAGTFVFGLGEVRWPLSPFTPLPGRLPSIIMFSSAFPLAIFNLGGSELLLIFLIILLLFGGAKLPSLARGLGQSIKEFKKAQHEADEVEPAAPTDAAKPAEAKKTGSDTPTHGAN